MSMSAWGILAAPLLANAPIVEPADMTVQASATAQTDIFSTLMVMDESAMSDASGGADTAVDIERIALNIAKNDGSVSDTSVINSDTGQITDNVVSGNGGITTVFNNTGNGVSFQSIVNINIELISSVGN